MLLIDALNHIIDDGIEAARASYAKPRDQLKRDGAMFGFGECRGKTPFEILETYRITSDQVLKAHREQSEAYWYWRCCQAEIEWVMNVLSCILVAQGLSPIGMMTARGQIKAAQIIGVAEANIR